MFVNDTIDIFSSHGSVDKGTSPFHHLNLSRSPDYPPIPGIEPPSTIKTGQITPYTVWRRFPPWAPPVSLSSLSFLFLCLPRRCPPPLPAIPCCRSAPPPPSSAVGPKSSCVAPKLEREEPAAAGEADAEGSGLPGSRRSSQPAARSPRDQPRLLPQRRRELPTGRSSMAGGARMTGGNGDRKICDSRRDCARLRQGLGHGWR